MTSSSALQVQSGSVQNVPSLEIQSSALTSFPSSQTTPLVKTEGMSSASLSLTGGLQRTTIYTTTTPIVTGTGSITATPTAYTTAETTTATSTTTTTGQETILGKRVRRTSTKYEDFEQPPIVSHLGTVTYSSLSFPSRSQRSSKTETKELEVDNTETNKIEKTGRLTNQLQYLKNVHRIVWRHHYAWPFHKPVDPVALKIPVSIGVILLGMLYCTCMA